VGQYLLIDCLGVNPLPKAASSRILIDFLGTMPSPKGPIAFYNVGPDLYSSIADPFAKELRRHLFYRLFPFILIDGRWRWLGLNESLEDELNQVLRDDGVTSFGSGKNRWLAYADRNRQVIAVDPVGGRPLFTASPRNVLSEIVRHEQTLLTQTFRAARPAIMVRGLYTLPSGFHVDRYIATFRFTELPGFTERVLAIVARELWLRRVDTIATFSLYSFLLSERLRAMCGVRVIHTFGYPFPRPRYDEVFRQGERVFVMTDIFSTGASMQNLTRLLASYGALVAGACAVVDAHGRAEKANVQSFVQLKIRLLRKVPKRRSGVAVDPFTCLPYALARRGKTRIGIVPSGWMSYALEKSCAARQGHFSYNGNHFGLFVDTRAILRDTACASYLAGQAVRALGGDFDLIVVPKNEGALLLATAVQRLVMQQFGKDLPVVACSRLHEENRFVMPLGVRGGRKILVLDDGANTGHTLLGLADAVQALRPASVRFLVFLDRLIGSDWFAVRRILKDDYACLYHLAVPVYRVWDCPLCLALETQELRRYGQVREQSGPTIQPARALGPRPVRASRDTRGEEP
jgi:orotate phosphoribosyltransferase